MTAVITVDEDGHVLDLNVAAERIFGFERPRAVGKDVSELLFSPVSESPGSAVLEEAPRSGRT